MLIWFQKLSFFDFAVVLSIVNILMYFLSWFIVYTLQKLTNFKRINLKKVVVSRRDYLLSFLTVILNILAGIPGWWLWKNGYIILVDVSFLKTLFHMFIIFVYFDFAMYFLHRLMHFGPLYKPIHSRHHGHEDVNGISLYVLSPFESIGFGFLLILFLLILNTSIYALMVFLLFNWLFGTIGHSGVVLKNKIIIAIMGDSEFHHKHHSDKKGNYGFFTKTWDYLFGTVI